MLGFVELLVIVGITIITASVALRIMSGRAQLITPEGDVFEEPLSLLFDDEVLYHANPAALNKFVLLPGIHVWQDLHDNLVSRFPDFPRTAGTGPAGSIKIRSKKPQDPTVIELNWRDGLCWVELRNAEANPSVANMEHADFAALARSCASSRQPSWETDTDGALCWKNAAYDRLLEDFDLSDTRSLTKEIDVGAGPQRIMAENKDGIPEWLELTATPHGTGITYHATCITALAKAEEAQRSFVQTLAKTFAHLPIGLAIFDDCGRLTIFNPAMVDLTGLQASFLATQPTMINFFDNLRESRRMPEPKNYRSWREDISEMIAAASGGQYRETWTLEDGRTYAVQGRPHPDGATAFLIEDISAEVTLTRSYRAEVEKFETMLDSVNDALVAFSGTGVLTFCNAAYREMFQQNPEAAFADVTLSDATKLWNEKTGSDTDWSKVSQFIAGTGPRKSRHLDVPIKSQNKVLHCDVNALVGQGTLVRFTLSDVESSELTNRLMEWKKSSGSLQG